MRLFIVIIILLFASALMAYPDSLKAIKTIDLAISKIDSLEYDSVDIYAKLSFNIFIKNKDLSNWMLYHRRLGYAWRNHGHAQKALESYNKGVEGMWRKPKNEKEYKNLGSLYLDIGYTYYRNLNEFYIAKGFYEKANSIYSDTLGLENYNVARYIFKPLGNIFSGLRDSENSIFYHNKAKRIFIDLREWDQFGSSCYNIALMFNGLLDYSQADLALQEGLNLIDSLVFEKKMQLLTMACKNYSDIGEPGQAMYYNNWANDLLKKNVENISKADLDYHKYEIYYNYGLLFKEKEKFKEAEKYYHRALEINKKSLGDRRQFAVLYQKFGRLYLDWNKPEKAKEYYLKSIDFLLPVLTTVNDPDLIISKTLIAEPVLSYAFEGVAMACIKKYEKHHNQKELEKAVQYFDLSNEVGLLLLENYTTEGSRLKALNNQRKLKALTLNAVYKLFQIEPNEVWKEKMFAISESSKSFLQLEAAQLSQNIDNWSIEKRLEYSKLKTELANLESSIYELKSSGLEIGDHYIDSLSKAYLKTNEAIANIRNEELNKVRVNNSVNSKGIFSYSRIRDSLAEDQVLIEYFLSKEKLYIFSISKNEFFINQKELPKNFHQKLDDFRSIFLNYSSEEFDQTRQSFIQLSMELYKSLLKETIDNLPENCERLVIVRDNVLNFIPFEILLNEKTSIESLYADLPYLIRKFSISYAPSASLFYLQQQWKKNRAQSLFAGYAPAYDPKKIIPEDTIGQELYASVVRDGEFELPGAVEEIETIGNILNGQKFMGNAASEIEFKNNAGDYQVLLLSMHSLVNENNPKFTKLLFTKGASGEQEDDYLYALELNDMQLNADLVVLSACNTGYGKLQPGEGVMSLSRSFFAASVPSTVMSLWKVPDAQTKEIMVHFFSNLKEGMSKDKALQQAKLEYLDNINSRQEANPFYWAGFVVAGNVEPLDLNTGISMYWWIGGSLLLILSFLYFKYSK